MNKENKLEGVKYLYVKWLPFKSVGFPLLKFVVLKIRELKDYAETITHENTHIIQQRELTLVGFLLLYVLFWILNLFWCPLRAYRNVPFEIEAYKYENDSEYLSTRKKHSWKKYLFKSYKNL